jgi:type I restriction enzyme, S subunit
VTWKSVKFGEVCDLVNGKAFKPADWSTAGTPIIRIQNLNGGGSKFNFWAGSVEKQVQVAPNDMLLAWSGTPGTSFGAHIWRGPKAILNQHIFRVDVDKRQIEKRWAVFAVNSQLNRLIELAHGGVGLKHVTRGVVEKLEIPLPPVSEQRRIAAILDRADELRGKRRATLGQIEDFAEAVFFDLFGDPRQNRTGWPIVSLGELCIKLVDGCHKTPAYVQSGVPFITVSNIVSGTLDFKQTKFITQDEHAILTKRVKPVRGDILVSKDGTIGVPCPVETDREFSVFVTAYAVTEGIPALHWCH